MATSIPIAVRGSNGISVDLGPPSFGNLNDFSPVLSKSCRTLLFSSDGKYFAYINGGTIKIIRTDIWKDVAVIEGTKAYYLAFSPKGTYLLSWETFITNKDNPQGTPNLNVYKTEDGSFVKSFVHKKQMNWEPQWSADELLFARLVNTDIVFYENCNFEKIVGRINCCKVATYSISPMVGSYYVLLHSPGAPGQPSFGKLFKYPNFDNQQVIANKSFFQADKVEYYWNAKGNSVLLLTVTEVDKTSYYGKQGLHFIGTSGQTSIVTMSKEGPIYSVAWSPKGQEFCVIYGFTPAKSTIFNLKCEPVFELGVGPKNSIYYNIQGNILLLGGFGNLPGQIEIWDAVNKKLISKCDAPDTTHLEWSPEGTHFLTATTAPRLRIGNGYKIWHYSGILQFEKSVGANEELNEICWQKYAKGTYKDPVISSEKVEGIVSSQPQASKQAYRPPSARNRPVVNFKLHDDDDQPHKSKDNAPSKAALKQKKKREARKARKAEEGSDDQDHSPTVATVKVDLTGDPEKDKKIKNIKKKLDAIEKLKLQQLQGKLLEINQLSKIKGEGDLLKELKELQV
ncbi:Eukaryotic translation initiation factor eIF2A [Popillia japonica]|uniref:Eukaryotic translation initiation factor 2A n=1 Tax=Popillia japonica TaxID=7064 RepID=A0AAW1N386_POPJA